MKQRIGSFTLALHITSSARTENRRAPRHSARRSAVGERREELDSRERCCDRASNSRSRRSGTPAAWAPD
jgi:hypothetical protein